MSIQNINRLPATSIKRCLGCAGLLLVMCFSQAATAVVSLERTISNDGKDVVIEKITAMMAGDENSLLVLDSERGSLTELKGNTSVSHKLSGEGKAFDSDNVRAIASLGGGRYLVSNAGDDSVAIIDGTGKKISLVAQEGSDQGKLSDPYGIAWSNNRRMYVAEAGNNRISVFGDDGVFIRSMGNRDAKEGQKLEEPSQLAVDPGERVYVLEQRDGGIVSVIRSVGKTFLSQIESAPS